MLGPAFQADMGSGGLDGRKTAIAPKGGVLGFRGSGVSDDDEQPGPVGDTDSQHAARHRVFHPRCGRCVYHRNRERLERGYGSYVHPGGGDRVRRTTWLAPRPVRLDGAWGVGCVLCAHARQHWADKADNARREGRPLLKGRRGPNAADTAWARYEINNAAQIASRGVRQHSETMQHRKAVKLFFLPGGEQCSGVVCCYIRRHALPWGCAPGRRLVTSLARVSYSTIIPGCGSAWRHQHLHPRLQDSRGNCQGVRVDGEINVSRVASSEVGCFEGGRGSVNIIR